MNEKNSNDVHILDAYIFYIVIVNNSVKTNMQYTFYKKHINTQQFQRNRHDLFSSIDRYMVNDLIVCIAIRCVFSHFSRHVQCTRACGFPVIIIIVIIILFLNIQFEYSNLQSIQLNVLSFYGASHQCIFELINST